MRTGIVGAPQLSFRFRFADHVHNARVARCHGHTNAIHLTLGQPDVAILARQTLPGVTTIHRFVDRRVPATRFQMPRPTPVRVHARIQNVGVTGVGRDIGARRLRIHKQHAFPGRATVGRLEHAAFFVGPPLASQSAHIYQVGIP